MNYTEIDWGYLVEILAMMESEQPLFPIEEWPTRHKDARLRLIEREQTDAVLGLPTEGKYRLATDEEKQDLEDNYKRLHRHTHFLLDLDFIEQHDKDENTRRFPGGRGRAFWRHNYEVWPKRITAKGYLFLEMVREGETSGSEPLVQRLQRAGTLVGTEAIKHGIGEVFKILGNF